MADEPNPSPSEDTPVGVPLVARKKQRRISWVWLVPIVAALAGLSLVVRTWMQTGPEITIQFNTAEGLEVGKTQVRYKDVNVGIVTDIRFSQDRGKVLVKAELARDVADLAREGTEFWVVRPRVNFSGVSGLGTLLSGAYIGMDATEDGEPQSDHASKMEFVGLETPPSVTHDRQGRRFLLQTTDLGSLDIGSPVYYRRIKVGRVVGYHLDETGKQVNIEVFIDSPNDRYVTNGTRFWNASGVDMSINADGLQLRTQSLVSLAVGGIAFEPVSERDTSQAKPDATFQLYDDERAAKADPDGEPYTVRMRFDQSIRGLGVGAEVDFQGIALGNVSRITIDFDKEKTRFFAVVEATLYPSRLGRVFEVAQSRVQGSDDEAGDRLLRVMVKYGLRAQLRPANLLTGQLYVVLDNFPNAKPATLDIYDGAPWIPTVPGQLDQLQQQVSNIVSRLEKIPFEEIGANLRDTLTSMNRVMVQIDKQLGPQASAVLKEARESLRRVDNMLASDGSLPVNTERAMQEITRAARSMRALTDYLQANPEALVRGRGDDPIPGWQSIERQR